MWIFVLKLLKMAQDDENVTFGSCCRRIGYLLQSFFWKTKCTELRHRVPLAAGAVQWELGQRVKQGGPEVGDSLETPEEQLALVGRAKKGFLKASKYQSPRSITLDTLAQIY